MAATWARRAASAAAAPVAGDAFAATLAVKSPSILYREAGAAAALEAAANASRTTNEAFCLAPSLSSVGHPEGQAAAAAVAAATAASQKQELRIRSFILSRNFLCMR